ncbi:hypothetical protein G7Y89_g9271 [Cudoniella acicularis]|uniref:Thymidylate kinase protein n=1 Tax=Cudoniella acicularis TaxID=354080 RepID=A0A8H4RHS7_9HELO|nr:hypothetical protein G7Y89_g9271 [Cudoniella acicularis]
MATHMPMAAARQPFAPLNSSRLQNLTSLKNRQNGMLTIPPVQLHTLTLTLTPYNSQFHSFNSTSTCHLQFVQHYQAHFPPQLKRKAQTFEDDNTENIDPIIFLSPKRSKNPDGSSSKDTLVKPVNFFLTKAPPSPNDFSSIKSTTNTTTSPRRPILPARSPAPKLNTSLLSKSTPLSAPAGRSPTRKRIGILSRRKTGSPFTRVDPPKFSTPSTGSGLGFSIDAALSGTIPSYGARQRQASAPKAKEVLPVDLHQPEVKDSWFFDIHEDTAEELATNMMEHSTCTLDISSDEESAARMRDERGKENVPPPDDVSQTRTVLSSSSLDMAESSMSDLKARIKARRSRRQLEEGAIEIDRSPLGDLAAEDFYAEGCDGESVFLIPSDVPEEEEAQEQEQEHAPMAFDFVAEVKGKGPEVDIDTLMQKDDFEMAPKAVLLEPIEKAEDGFDVWESGSSKGENEC